MRVLSTLPVMASATRGWGKAPVQIYSSRGTNDEPAQSGHLFIMFVTEDDFTDLEGYVNQGISCKISGANRFDESGLLKLKKKNPGEFFVFS